MLLERFRDQGSHKEELHDCTLFRGTHVSEDSYDGVLVIIQASEVVGFWACTHEQFHSVTVEGVYDATGKVLAFNIVVALGDHFIRA